MLWKKSVWLRFSWIKSWSEHLRSGGDAHIPVTETGVRRRKFELVQRASCDSELRKMRMRMGCGLWVLKQSGFWSYFIASTCWWHFCELELWVWRLSLSSTCSLSDALTGISSLLNWIVLEYRLIEKLGVLMLRSSLAHRCVSDTLSASVTRVCLWLLVLI